MISEGSPLKQQQYCHFFLMRGNINRHYNVFNTIFVYKDNQYDTKTLKKYSKKNVDNTFSLLIFS